MHIKYILLEDEYYTSVNLKKMISEIRPGYIPVGESDSAGRISELIQNTTPDLIIADIQLADGTCINALRKFWRNNCLIIFTGFEKYKTELKGLNVIDFVLKPISKEDIACSIEKFENTYNNFY